LKEEKRRKRRGGEGKQWEIASSNKEGIRDPVSYENK